MLQEILTAVFTAITGILVGFIVYGIKKLIAWLNTKISDKEIQNILTKATDVVEMVVQEVYQTYVEGLKSGGAFNQESQLAALNMAKDKIMDMLSTDVKEYINKTYGNLETWLTSKIESTIYNKKNGVTEVSNTEA